MHAFATSDLIYLSCKSSNPPLFKRETIHWTTVYQNLMAINNIQIHIFKNSYTCNKRLQYVVNIYMSGTYFWPFIYVVRYTCYKKNLICFLQILINTYEKKCKKLLHHRISNWKMKEMLLMKHSKPKETEENFGEVPYRLVLGQWHLEEQKPADGKVSEWW